MLSALLCVGATPSDAQEFRNLPAPAAVADIADDDRLNVRAAPNAASRIVGKLRLGQKTEIIALTPDKSWAQIVLNEGNGWVAARYLDPVARPLSTGGLPLGLICTGNEPFWSVEIATSNTVSVDIAGGGKTTAPLLWSGTSRNVGSAAYGFSRDDMSGTLRRAGCSDGMSDRAYGWSLDFILAGDAGPQIYSGCCTSR